MSAGTATRGLMLRSLLILAVLLPVGGGLVAPVGAHPGVSEGGSLLIRGPYLQMGSSSSVVVRWRTSTATNGRVRFGPEPADLPFQVGDPTVTTEHQIEIDSLLPETTYFYSVGTATQTLAGADADHFFRTAPATGDSASTRIWVIGDSGTADANARAVRDAFEVFSAGHPADLWLMLGDNAYVDGTDAEYQTAVFETYPRILRQTVLWPTLGNHDGHSANSATQTGPYFDMFTLPDQGQSGGVASGTEAFYSFDYGDIHFICLDSHQSDRTPGGAMLTWLEDDLLAASSRWLIAFWHHPPYSKGSHDSDTESRLIEMRENVLPLLEDFGIDLVLAGHSHSYERSFLLDRHYGDSTSLLPSMLLDAGDGNPAGGGAYLKTGDVPMPHEGAVYAVAGSSGRIGGGTLDHPAMLVSMSQLGSLVLDFHGNVLEGRFLKADGTVADGFAVVKGENPWIFADGFETGATSRWSFAVP